MPKTLGSEVLSGSFCVDGEARYVATRVGAGTFANQLTAGARAFRADRTPLQRDVARVLRGMSLLVLIAAVPVLIRLYSQYGKLPAIETARAAAVLVALIPQGLVVMITVTYAMAIVRLAGQKALIQRSNAVESMSRVSVLCLDKTGTLTTPEIEVAEVHPLIDEAELARWLGSFVASTSLQNRSSDAIRGRFPDGQKLTVAEEVPFSSELRWSAIRVSEGDLAGAFVLGAPEVLGPSLAAVPAGHADMDRLVAEKAGQGLRVVLFARRRAATEPLLDAQDRATLPTDLEPLGVLVLQEQIRPDARATLARFADAGVTLKLISGDNPVTVAALARHVGLSLDGEAISGLELAGMDDAALSEAVRTRSVFGRVPPSLKARLVGSLRESGEWVAMVGDGVNDILSLKQAQLGISMQSGSQATRAVADIVLLEDSFSALPEAVLEGQRIIAGMHDSLAVFLTRVLYMALAILGASLVGLAMPVDPKLNTVVALLTVGIPALFLAVWARPQRSSPDALRQILRLVAPPAAALVLLGLPLYWWSDPAADIDRARTLFTTFAVFCGLALLPLLHPPVGKAQDGSEQEQPDVRPTILAVVMLVLFGLFFLIPPLRDFFELTPLSAADVLVTGAACGGLDGARALAVARTCLRPGDDRGPCVAQPDAPSASCLSRGGSRDAERPLHVRDARQDAVAQAIEAGVHVPGRGADGRQVHLERPDGVHVAPDRDDGGTDRRGVHLQLAFRERRDPVQPGEPDGGIQHGRVRRGRVDDAVDVAQPDIERGDPGGGMAGREHHQARPGPRGSAWPPRAHRASACPRWPGPCTRPRPAGRHPGSAPDRWSAGSHPSGTG